ncbi:MAG: hypothetical protein R2759_11005 [Bacteroidales bacterium]
MERIVGWVEDENQPGFLVPEQKYEFSFDAAGNRSGFHQYWYNQIWYDMEKPLLNMMIKTGKLRRNIILINGKPNIGTLWINMNTAGPPMAC